MKNAVQHPKNQYSQRHIDQEIVLGVLDEEGIFSLDLLKLSGSIAHVRGQVNWLLKPTFYRLKAYHYPKILFDVVHEVKDALQSAGVVVGVIVIQLNPVHEQIQ